MWKKWLLIILGVVFIFALGFSVNQLIAKEDKGSLTDKEARELIQSLYGGEVKTFIQKGNEYQAEIENEFGQYTVKIDRNTGNVSSLVLTQKHETPPPKANHPEQRETPKTKIGERKAAEIALTKVKGEVDDVDLESFEGSHVYAVEIELDDDREAVVYVQAYTGEILSYTFED
ncbi:PepSY domain-containing protein [Pueribacillus sp. YX66]|uniref:PepSY domain-containing protein n=1 Tax=Pueribacillus sp. YX66 TaxID=3229242 RepID=UPI00358D6676